MVRPPEISCAPIIAGAWHPGGRHYKWSQKCRPGPRFSSKTSRFPAENDNTGQKSRYHKDTGKPATENLSGELKRHGLSPYHGRPIYDREGTWDKN